MASAMFQNIYSIQSTVIQIKNSAHWPNKMVVYKLTSDVFSIQCYTWYMYSQTCDKGRLMINQPTTEVWLLLEVVLFGTVRNNPSFRDHML